VRDFDAVALRGLDDRLVAVADHVLAVQLELDRHRFVFLFGHRRHR
jgi:hypothetical protein